MPCSEQRSVREIASCLYIETNYTRTPPSWDLLSERYVYALALDDSSKAKELLSGVIKRTGNLDDGSTVVRAINLVQANQPAKLLTGPKDPGKLVLHNAFFVSPIDRKFTSARLLALNGAADKALIEVYINRGRLAEEWYHVVIRECDQGWTFEKLYPLDPLPRLASPLHSTSGGTFEAETPDAS